jgi:hypothetical protein
MRNPHEEEGQLTVQSESDSGVPLRPAGPRAGHRIWAGLAQIRSLGLNLFFLEIHFDVFTNPCKFEIP